MNSTSNSVRGSLMLELMIACFLLALVMPFLVSSLTHLREHHLLSLTYLDHHKVKAAIDAQFKAQWRRLIPAGCGRDTHLKLTIQPGRDATPRLFHRLPLSDSDWLKATDYGACRTTLPEIKNTFETHLNCHWKVGDRVGIATCGGRYDAQVISTTSQRTILSLTGQASSDQRVIGSTGMLESQDTFYWYLAKGKNGGSALWRTPDLTGNALELWAGLEKLSIMPLLDDTSNGRVNSLDTHYGDYLLEEVKALWVEYQYRLIDCRLDDQHQVAKAYHSMRGAIWTYHSPCQGVGNQLIVLTGES